MAAPGIPNWQAQVLKGVGAPVTPENLRYLNAWAQAEGGSASNNPFNTTQPGYGATGNYNPVGVKNYSTPQGGIQATISTLNNGRYGNILSSLRRGNSAMASAQALANSPWGTGSLVEKVLGGPVPPPGSAPPAASPPGGSIVPRSRPATPPGYPAGLQQALAYGNQLFGLGPLPSLPKIPSQNISSQVPASAGGGASLSSPTASAPPKAYGRRAVQIATKELGVPYVWGGASPKGFDCSGLLQYAWRQVGVNIPRTTYDQWQTGTAVDPAHLQPGDAVFFRGSDSRVENGRVLPGHVGIYIGGGRLIEAPHSHSTVRISTLAGRTDFMGARRYG